MAVWSSDEVNDTLRQSWAMMGGEPTKDTCRRAQGVSGEAALVVASSAYEWKSGWGCMLVVLEVMVQRSVGVKKCVRLKEKCFYGTFQLS
jgi:hypothetical protein